MTAAMGHELLSLWRGAISRAPARKTREHILRVTAQEYGVEVSDILGDSHCAEVVRARHAAMWEIRVHDQNHAPAAGGSTE